MCRNLGRNQKLNHINVHVQEPWQELAQAFAYQQPPLASLASPIQVRINRLNSILLTTLILLLVVTLLISTCSNRSPDTGKCSCFGWFSWFKLTDFVFWWCSVHCQRPSVDQLLVWAVVTRLISKWISISFYFLNCASIWTSRCQNLPQVYYVKYMRSLRFSVFDGRLHHCCAGMSETC